MDFDLFESEDDNGIFGTNFLEPTQHQTEQLLIEDVNFPEFCCNGEDTKNSQFEPEGFIKNSFIARVSQMEVPTKSRSRIRLTSYGFGFKQLCGRSTAQFLFGEAFMNLQYLVGICQGNPLSSVGKVEHSLYQRRQEITQLLQLILHSMKVEQILLLRPQVNLLRSFVNSISTKEMFKLIYFANSCKGNECNVPAYHLLHGLLEWKLLDLCILFKIEIFSKSDLNKTEASETVPSFILQLKNILDDLLTCSVLLYSKKKTSDLLFSTPFPCTCFKEFWLLLQLLLKEFKNQKEHQEQDNECDFWFLFNEAMTRLKLNPDSTLSSPIHFYEFTTWMIQALTRLYGYRSNGTFEGSNYALSITEMTENSDFNEQCTQKFLNLNPNEEQLRVHLCLLTPILLEWQRPRAAIPMLLWEYFHKRLNSAFYISGSSPNNLAVACGSGRVYLEKYRNLLGKMSSSLPDVNLCSYTLFTLLLGKCLERLCSTACSGNQAQKLLGRIYSKFSLQKFLSLNETGIHHIIELFLILALCGDFEELATKLREQLLSISFEKVTPQRQIAVAKGHVALLILFAEKQVDFTDYITKLLQQLMSIRNEVAVSKIIADGLLDIFKNSDGSFQLGEHLLIDAWLPSLLQNCTPVEQERTLEALHMVFLKCEKNRKKPSLMDLKNDNIMKSLQNHILPFVKQEFANSFSNWLPQLAADFCLNSDKETSTKLLNFFIETPTANRQMIPQFVLKILSTEECNKISLDDHIIMHVWLKSLVVLTPQHIVVSQLTKYVIALPVFSKMTNLRKEEVLQAKEPLCVFIAAVGKVYESSTYEQRCEISDHFNAYIRNFDKWLIGGADTKLDQLQEITMRFYSFLAIVIFNCPNIVYTKSKSNCFFHIALTRYILPTSIQIGKAPEGKLTQLVHKIWPVLVQGIGRLNFKSDAYIQKTLNDLIQKWTPLFKTISPNPKFVARPFVTCFLGENNELSQYIAERLTSLFMATQRRQADPHACLIISIFQEIVSSLIQETDKEQSEQHIKAFVKGTITPILEHIMMVDDVAPSHGMLLDLLRRLICSRQFRNSQNLQELFKENLYAVTKKYLAHHTFFYFDLLMKLAKISPELISKLMDFLLEQVKIVEQKRGTDNDNRIRSCLQQLRKCIDDEKQRSLP